ncbi:hypothetical protein V2J09_009038 [Rumex salicifolius]
MGRIRSTSNSHQDFITCAKVFFGVVVLLIQQFAHGFTNMNDVAAINSLYATFGSPPLPNWVSAAGDPCGQAWQGVGCDTANNIVSINLVGANLGGGLGDSLGSFSSLTLIDLSNNHISGSIPTSLPVTLQNFFLSDNNFTGNIPSSLSTLIQLSALKLNGNHLTGEIPDAFTLLLEVTSIDLSSNNLSGELPASMVDLSAMTKFVISFLLEMKLRLMLCRHLQDNQLSGPLDVLQDLPLQDLDISNNLFSGPVPEKLLAIPNFKKDGNPFNTTTAMAPSPSASSPATSSTTSPPSPAGKQSPPSPSSSSRSPPKPTIQANNPSSSQAGSGGRSNSSHTKKIILVSICSVVGFIILILALLLCLPSCFSKSRDMYHTYREEEENPPPYKTARDNAPHSVSAIQPSSQIDDVEKAGVVAQKEPVTPAEVRRIAAVPKPISRDDSYSQRMGRLMKQDSEMSDIDLSMMMPPPPPPPPPPAPSLADRVIVTPVEPAIRNHRLLTSVKSFTIASLQQYTNSFSQDNLLGSGMLGTVYKAELPNEKFLAVKKLDKGIVSRQKDYEFIELVNNIDLLRHANIVDVVGYCMEHGQRLLVYEYCGNGTLQDALHSEDEYKKQLSWNTRIQMALGAARALEYLHEICEPPVVHRNFKSNNILLDDDLGVRVSDCGLATLIASGSVSQLSGHLMSTYGYGAPEYDSGIYTTKSDVYSFGVVVLELLTGRMSYDRNRIRGEQFLVRWAIPQLHDIDALTRMVDPSLEGIYPAEPEFRPSMSEVVQDLQSMLQRGSPTKTSSFRG